MEACRSMEKVDQDESQGERGSGRDEFHHTVVALTSNFAPNQRDDWMFVVEYGRSFL